MHFVGIGAGSAGDVLPCLLAAQVLQARGHQVAFITAPEFRGMVESLGVPFIAGGSQEQFDKVIGDPDVWHPRRGLQTLWRHIGPLWGQAYQQLADVVQPGKSVVFGGALALQMRLVQERLGNPAVTIHLAPSSLLSAHDLPVMPGLGWLRRLPPRLVAPILALIERRVIDPMVLPDLNRFRGSIGLPPVRGVTRWMNSPTQVVCAFPAWFAAPQPDWPPRTSCAGFVLQESPPSTALPAPLTEFLDAGPPPLLFTPGSGMAHGREFFARAVDSAEALGMRAVLVTRYPDQLPKRLPAFACHVHGAPFDLLVPRTAMLIHHGGIGTIARGLAAGKPQLITPFSYDQPDNARRLRRLGVARSVSTRGSSRTWAMAARSLLEDRQVAARCRELAARLREDGSGAERMADRLEAAALPSPAGGREDQPG
jgi:rhamnosyltransferase subunit B